MTIDNSVIKETSQCSSLLRAKQKEMCDSRVEKCVFSKNSVLRPCSDCLRNELECIKLAVLGKGMDSESRNQTARDIFKENKLSGEINSELTYCETFIDIDAVHVGKERGRVLQIGFF